MATRPLGKPGRRPLLAHLSEMSNLADVVPRLEPDVLHQVIRVCGLESSAEIVALATPAQLTSVFDEDLWASAQVGVEEQLDAGRFGLWLEVLVEAGVERAAATLMALDRDFVATALYQHLVVLDPWTARSPRWAEVDVSYELSGYTLVARRQDAWDAILAILVHLDAEAPDDLLRLLQLCCRQSIHEIDDNGRLYDVLTADARLASDVAFAREQRRERRGFVTPVQATAFLTSSRQLTPDATLPPAADPSTIEYFRQFAPAAEAAPLSTVQTAAAGGGEAATEGVREVMAALRDEDVREGVRLLRLPDGGRARDRLGRIRHFFASRDPAAHAAGLDQIGYLTNVVVAGCSFDARRFAPAEAADAVWATCNLGLDRWPRPWPAPVDVITIFRVGWRWLHEHVVLYIADRLVAVLGDLTTEDRVTRRHLQALRQDLRHAIRAGTPWIVRDDLDVLAIFDLPTWSVLLRLLDQCPVVPRPDAEGALGARPLRVTSRFEFIADDTQIDWVRSFGASLLTRLVE